MGHAWSRVTEPERWKGGEEKVVRRSWAVVMGKFGKCGGGKWSERGTGGGGEVVAGSRESVRRCVGRSVRLRWEMESMGARVRRQVAGLGERHRGGGKKFENRDGHKIA